MMRLRLHIIRNELPPVQILFSVDEPSCTISNLLELVNLQIPLESAHWGLEDYVVTLDGYECLHYSRVDKVLQNDDRVNIQPLAQIERKARLISGRVQIAQSGAHLLDGIPYGRAYLRKPHRPTVQIPPRKKRRIENDNLEDGDTGHRSLMPSFEDEAVLGRELVRAGELPTRRAAPVQQGVHFEDRISEDDPPNEGLHDSDDEDDEYEPDSSEVSDDVEEETEKTTTEDSDSDSDSFDSSPEIFKSSGSSRSAVSTEKVNNFSSSCKTKIGVQPVAPGQGTKDTQMRNRRRKQARRLKYLKSIGTLPMNASIADLANMPSDNESGSTTNVHIVEKVPRDDLTDLAREEEGAKANNDLQISKSVRAPKIDVPSSRRFLFGSLGLRAPKTTEDAEELRSRLATVSRTSGTKPDAKADILDLTPVAGEWKQSVILSAVECDDRYMTEDGCLSTPPYPFYQRWDGSQCFRGKKRKRMSTNLQVDQESHSLEDESLIVGSAANESFALSGPEPSICQIDDPEDDLPPLPDDLEQLAPLSLAQCKKGAVITYRCYEVSASTQWAPALSPYRTALVELVTDSSIQLVLAKRDRAKREITRDAHGKRLYSGFEAPDVNSEDELDMEEMGIISLSFTDLVDARLVHSADEAPATWSRQ